MAGAILSYLVNNFLIDSDQYDAWSGLSRDELKKELLAAGIMNSTEFDEFGQQLADAGLQEPQGELIGK